MPTSIAFVFAPEDEKQFLTILAPFELRMYPDRVPPRFRPPLAAPAAQPELTEEGYYLAAENIAPVVLRPIKRGKDRGWSEVDEVNCPVIHYDRSLFDEIGQLRSGKLWCELNLSGDMQRNPAFPESFRRILTQIREWVLTKNHRSQPAGFMVGPQAARLSKAGTILREQGRKGGVLKPYR